MKANSCRFCDHANPEGSRFCNACGSPLDLGPCPHCEAVNNALADRCYQCGELLSADDGRKVAEAGAHIDAAFATGSPATARRRSTLDSIPVAFSKRVDANVRGGEAPAPGLPERQGLPTRTSREVAIDDGGFHSRRDAGESARMAYRPDKRGLHAVLLGFALAVLAGGAYYAYVNGMGSALTDASDAAVSVDTPPEPLGTARAGETAQAGDATPSRPAKAAVAGSPSSVTSPTASANATSRNDAASQASTTEAGKSVAPAATGRAFDARNAAPPRTPRRPREAVRAVAPDAPAVAAPGGGVDRGAIETERLIARDLAGFVPPPAQNAPPPR